MKREITKTNSYQPKPYELEFRVYPSKVTRETLNKFTYYYFLDFLKKSNIKFKEESTVDFLSTISDSATRRSTYDNFTLKNPINIKKERLLVYRPPNPPPSSGLTFKLSLSTESTSPITVGLKVIPPNIIGYDLVRIKQRNSFYFPLWRIDITKVLTIKHIEDPESGMETYELEAEYIGNFVPFETFIDSMSFIYKFILMHSNYC